jgi:hypothetical protein
VRRNRRSPRGVPHAPRTLVSSGCLQTVGTRDRARQARAAKRAGEAPVSRGWPLGVPITREDVSLERPDLPGRPARSMLLRRILWGTWIRILPAPQNTSACSTSQSMAKRGRRSWRGTRPPTSLSNSLRHRMLRTEAPTRVRSRGSRGREFRTNRHGIGMPSAVTHEGYEVVKENESGTGL